MSKACLKSYATHATDKCTNCISLQLVILTNCIACMPTYPHDTQIFIREKKVKVKRMTSLLRDKIQETYRPQSNPDFRCDIEMGFNTENENLYGMMLYHRNRLIRPYHRLVFILLFFFIVSSVII